MKFNIQVNKQTITQSALFHDDIPGYDLLTLEFVLPPKDDDEDLIFEEENLCASRECIGAHDQHTRCSHF